jgi:hypothetical protein
MSASLCKRVGEAESAENNENTNRLSPSLDNRGNDCLDSAGTVPNGGPLRALLDEAGKGTERDRPGEASTAIGQEAMEKSDPYDSHSFDAVQHLEAAGRRVLRFEF